MSMAYHSETILGTKKQKSMETRTKAEQSHDQIAQLLASAYALILSWPNLYEEEKTAVSENLGRDTESAAKETPTKQEDVA